MASLVDGVAADGAFAVDDRQAHEGPALVEGLVAVNTYAIDGVAGVRLEFGHAAHLGRGHRAVGRSLNIKVDAVEALLNVQRAQLAIGAGTVVVVKAICHVARLLRLQNERAGLDGVHGTGIDLEKVALVNRQHVEHVVPAAVLDHLCGLGAVMRALADDDRGAGLAVQHIPALGLAQAAVLVLGGVLVVGMNLDRKIVLGVQNLNEQRELLALAVAKELAVLGPQPRQRVTGIRALSNLAVAVGMGRDGPALTDGALGNVVAKYGFELAAAPDLLVEDRRQFNQIGHVHTPMVLCGRPFST